MKRSLFLIFLFLQGLNSYSQSLVGEWKGDFTAYLPLVKTVNEYYKNPFSIEVLLNEDSTYTIYSYASEPYDRAHISKHKCQVNYLMLSKDVIFLEEIKAVEPENIKTCYKKMNLKIIKKKKEIIMEGTWLTNTPDGCDNEGRIYLSKRL